MPSKGEAKTWDTVKLGITAHEIRDLYEPKDNRDLPYIGLEHIEQQTLQLNGIGSSLATVSTKKKFKSGDILFGSLRPYFRKVFVPKFDGVCSTDITVVRAKLNTDQTFLFYFMANKPFIDYASNISSGTRMPRANWKVLEKSKWLFPPLPTQRKIATILSAYDDLIENNLRRIKILEEMAQMIYREWFVNFRFPGHEKVRLVDSPLGKIPEGWEVKRATDSILFNPRMKVDKDKIKPHVDMKGLSESSMIVEQTGEKSGSSGSKFQKSDTLFARITPCLENGKTGFVQFLSEGQIGMGSTEFIVMRSIDLTPEYVYLLSRTNEFRGNAIKSMAGASGRQRIQNECFAKFMFAKPPENVLNSFSDTVRPMFNLIHELSLKNANLRKTRDLLLPRLISGELDVEGLDIKNTEETEA
jgi:type I restriction enzyme S subunit